MGKRFRGLDGLRPSTAPWILLGTGAAGILNYAYSFAMTGLLMPAQYAVFASGQALLLITGTVANAAVPWLLAREIAAANAGAPADGVVAFAIVLNVVEGALAGVVVVLLATQFAGTDTALWVGASTMAYFLASTGMGWAQGYERFALLSALIVGEVALKVVSGVVFVSAGFGASGALAAAAVGAVFITVAMILPMRSDLRTRPKPVLMSRLWTGALGLTSVQALVTLMSVADILFVSLRFQSAHSIAGYQVAATLARTPLFIALAFATQAFPSLARSPGNPRILSTYFNRMLQVLAPVLVIVSTVPSTTLSSFFPSGYASAATFLPATIVTGIAFAIVIFQTTVLRAGGRLRDCLAVLAASALLLIGFMAVGSVRGVLGMAIGAAAGACVTVAALSALTSRVWPGAQRIDAKPLKLWLSAEVILGVVRLVPLVWFIGAACVVGAILRSVLVIAEPVPEDHDLS